MYGVMHRGFTDPGLQVNHGRFTGILTPLQPSVREIIDRCGVAHLLHGTGIPQHLFQAAVEREISIAWDSLSANAFTEVGRYLRDAFGTVEIDDVPIRYRWGVVAL